MANQEIHEPTIYSQEIRKLQTTDPSHADVFNPLFERLINNDVFLKSLTERLIQEHTHSGADGEGSQIPLANIKMPVGEGKIVTDQELARHINERNPHGTRAGDVGAASKQEFDGHSSNSASTSKVGHVQLSSATTSVDETKAATPNAVKKVNDSVETLAGVGNTKTVKQVDDAITTHSAEVASQQKTGHMSSSDKTKLDEVEQGANNYTHPTSHPASMITETTTKRFVTDTEKENWNSKETPEAVQVKVNALAGAGNTKTVKQLDDSLTTHKANKASLTKDGHVQLSSEINSDDETKAATPRAVNSVRNLLEGKANKSQEAWIKPVLLNGWINRNLETRYFKDEFGLVHIEGYVEGGTTGLIFTLPTGYRPDALIAIHGLPAETLSYPPINMLISASGEVTATTVGGVFPSSLTFRSSFRAK